MDFNQTFNHYFKLLTEMPQISLKDKKVYADENPLKNLPSVDVKENIVVVRQPTPGGFIAQGYTLVYFMDSAEAAQDFYDNKIPYLTVPRGTFYSGGSPITDIWKKRFQKEGHQHILGMIEGNSMEDVIFIDMMTVRANYRRNGITTHMINRLKEMFPNAEVKYSSQTDDGKKFAAKYDQKKSNEKRETPVDITSEKKTVKGTIKFDRDNGEYVAKVWLNGKHHEGSDYFTDDKQDAIGTLKNRTIPYWVEQGYTDVTTI